jgi:hypothetical protein
MTTKEQANADVEKLITIFKDMPSANPKEDLDKAGHSTGRSSPWMRRLISGCLLCMDYPLMKLPLLKGGNRNA